MQLSKVNLPDITSTFLTVPPSPLFSLPEKVLQFGTGVLLKGLPDYFIDKANKKGIFNGRVVMIKSTGPVSHEEFEKQDGLFTHCIKGILHGKMVEEYVINAAVSRAISACTHWREVLDLAGSGDLKIIISNTTEAGLVYDENDNSLADPPQTFPYKLYAFLRERYKLKKGDRKAGYVILPTELLVDNAGILTSILRKIAEKEVAGEDFISWMFQANIFCNTLVDRIVPGKLMGESHKGTESKLGYGDSQMIMSEPYALWAIESDNPYVQNVLSFAAADPGVVITPDISGFRELKLRLLNASHSFSCALAYLSGFETVKEAMSDARFHDFLIQLMKKEIIPCITGKSISMNEANAYADAVIDRFSNPHLEHRWLSISVHYTKKIRERILPLLEQNATKSLSFPEAMARGFAAWLLFMKTTPGNEGQFYGERESQSYKVQDDAASWLSSAWRDGPETLVEKVLKHNPFWGADVTVPEGFAERVLEYLNDQSGILLNR